MRSGGSNNLALAAPGSWRHGSSTDNGSSSSNNNNHEDGWNRRVGVPSPVPYRSGDGGGMNGPWRLFEDRVRTGPYGLSSFPSQPYSPVRILIIHSSGDGETVNPRLRQFIQESPPRIRGEWNLGLALPEPENPGLTQEEFKTAMKKMRKQVYNPTYPRRRAWGRGLFKSSSTYANTGVTDEAEKRESKDCIICLESFVSNDQVLVTPCNHMFHNDCLVPWVKSHGQCPVCRYALCERRGSSLPHTHTQNNNNSNSNNINNSNGIRVTDDDEQLAMDIIYLIRAMEEAFNWINLSP